MTGAIQPNAPTYSMHNLQVATVAEELRGHIFDDEALQEHGLELHAFPVFLRQGGEGPVRLAFGLPALDDHLDEAQPDLLRCGLLLEQSIDEPRNFPGERRDHPLNLSQLCHPMIDWRGVCDGLTGLGRRTA